MSDQFQQGIDEVHKLKQNMSVKVNQMLSSLDQKAQTLQSKYNSCFENKCLDLKPSLGKDVLEIGDSELFVKEAYVDKVAEYNECVDECQQELRKFRFDCEF
jgi:hypothetical protein